MSQESLRFSRLDTVRDHTRRVYRLLNDDVDLTGGIVPAAGACGIDRSDLRRALDRDGRRLAVEHAMSIVAMVCESHAPLAKQICDAMIAPSDFEAVRCVRMTDKERADRLEAHLRAMPLGEQLVAMALGEKR